MKSSLVDSSRVSGECHCECSCEKIANAIFNILNYLVAKWVRISVNRSTRKGSSAVALCSHCLPPPGDVCLFNPSNASSVITQRSPNPYSTRA